MTDLSGNPIFKVSLGVDSKLIIACLDDWGCRVQFHPNYTPSLVTFEPAHFYIGQTLTFRLKPLGEASYMLNSIKIGKNNCIPNIPENFSENWGDMLLTCSTGDSYSVEKIKNFMVNFLSGYTSIPSFFLKQDVDPLLLNNNSGFYFKIFPRIDSVNFLNGGSNGGQNLIIKGAGFIPDKSKVYINNDECIVQNTNNKLIQCITKPSTIDPSSTSPFLGSRGLRWRVYTGINSINGLMALSGFPDNLTNLKSDDILLETSTAPTGKSNYGQFISGYFKAVYTGKYRFWITSDDGSQLFLSTDTTIANKVKLIDFNTYTNYNDYLTQSDKTKSAWVNLVAGSLYYMEIYHVQSGIFEHFRLGMEIDQNIIVSTQANPLPNPLPNQINKIQLVNIIPKFSRDLYEFTIISLTSTPIYSVNCKNKDNSIKSLVVNPTWTAQQFKDTLGNFMEESRLIVRKLGYNDQNQYYLGASDTFDDSSFTTSYNFSDMYLNLSGVASTASTPLKTYSNGTKVGVVFLVFIDRRSTDRTNRWENNCYLSTSTNPNTPISIPLKQSVSFDITGTFKLKVKDAVTNVEYITPEIDMTNISSDSIKDALDSLPMLTNKVQVYMANRDTDITNFYVRYGLYTDISIIVASNTLKGGLDNYPIITITNYDTTSSKNLFFYPIPADFLYVKNDLPQVRVVVNGFESVCLFNKCSYNYINTISFRKLYQLLLMQFLKIFPLVSIKRLMIQH